MGEKYIFLGKFLPERLFEFVSNTSSNRSNFSNHNFEMSLLKGFQRHSNLIDCITLPHIGSYPHNIGKWFIPSERYTSQNLTIKSVGYFNLAGVNQISKYIFTVKNLVTLFRKYGSETIRVIVNPPDYMILSALKAARKLSGKKIDTTLIIPDIPTMISTIKGEESIKDRMVKRMNDEANRLMRESDRYVLLTEKMTDFIPEGKPYMVMEGLLDMGDYRNQPLKEEDIVKKEILLYSGTLYKVFGIMKLIESFQRANLANTELWICGTGDSDEEIRKKAREDGRIKFFGLVSPQKARELQKEATILVNPRTSEGEYTKYSFPSKTLEYLAAGKNVLMNRLPGVPEEYFRYVMTPDGETTDAWVAKLRELHGMDPETRVSIAGEGQRFVMENKNAGVQTRRILDFILESVSNGL